MSLILGQRLATAGRDQILVVGSFRPNGLNPPLDLYQGSELFSLTRTAVGVFTLVFLESYTTLIAKWVDLALPAPANTYAQCGAYTAPDPTSGVRGQIVISTLAGATPTDVAASPNARLSYGFVFRDTSLV